MNVAGTGMRVVVATRPVDFRKGHDGLAAVVEHELGLDPYSGGGGGVSSQAPGPDEGAVVGRDWCWRRSVWSRAALPGLRCATG